MQEYLLKMLIKMVLDNLTGEQMKEWVDGGIDYLEDAIEKSETKVDDILVLPLLGLIRQAFDIPDND